MDLQAVLGLLQGFIPEGARRWIETNVTEQALQAWRDQAEETKLKVDQIGDDAEDLKRTQAAQGLLLLRIAERLQIPVTDQEAARIVGRL